jgi:hypothetical protein
MYKVLSWFVLLMFATVGLAGEQVKRVVFEGTKFEQKWTVGELDFPSDWSGYEYLVMEIKTSTSQRFFLWVYTKDGPRRVVVHPFGQNVWFRASVPLKFFKRPSQEGFDLASTNNKPLNSFWVSLWGPFGSIDKVEALGMVMDYPLGKPVIEVRPVRLAKEDPGSEILEKLPVVNEFGQWIYGDVPRKVRDLEQLKKEWAEEDGKLKPGGFNYCKYGGYMNTKAKATGFFRVEKIDGKWWFVDPDGHLFLSMSVNCMGAWGSSTRTVGREDYYAALPPDDLIPSRRGGRRFRWGAFYSWNLFRRYGSDWNTKWIDKAVQRMETWGFNSIGNWSDMRLWDAKRKPYMVFLRGMGLESGYMGLPDVYSKEFAKTVDRVAAQQCAPRKDDPWLLGYFIGNEPPWPGRESELVDMILNGPVTAIQCEAKAFLAEEDTPKRRKAFVCRSFEKFLDIINAAVRKYDPNHLNLGIRFGGHPTDEVVRMARIFDVYSLNVYEYEPTRQMKRAYGLTGLPILIGEYHFGVPGNGLGAGLVQTANQRERGVGYRYYVEQAAALPAFIGASWFQWIDSSVTGRMDGENYNIGLLDVTDRPYWDFIEGVEETHKRLFDVHSGKIKPFDRKPKASEAGTPESPW